MAEHHTHDELYCLMGQCLAEVKALRNDLEENQRTAEKRLDAHAVRLTSLERARYLKDGAIVLGAFVITALGLKGIIQWIAKHLS